MAFQCCASPPRSPPPRRADPKPRASRRRTADLLCKAASRCVNMRESADCVFCAVHCPKTLQLCTVHWDPLGRCQTTAEFCRHMQPFLLTCLSRACRKHCADRDRCPAHSVARKKGHNRTVGLRSAARHAKALIGGSGVARRNVPSYT